MSNEGHSPLRILAEVTNDTQPRLWIRHPYRYSLQERGTLPGEATSVVCGQAG